ncbi:MAG: tRNA pseudouridine(55) synthase TruB [Clostridia bacterium]|nr:tRNA pseudouridine(55) synthase TruB [Clostridia bacterium]
MNNGEICEPCGVLLVDKPAGMTSHDVIYKVRKLYNTRRVGHTGTLDPMATGVLVVLVGRAAKACEYLAHDEKEYIATLRLGIITDTEDTSGNILVQSPQADIPSYPKVIEAVERFKGDTYQVPPMYSALKVGGQKLCDLARKGQTVERRARRITVFDIEATPTGTPTDYTLRVRCSGGTYIRTLCADIGVALGVGGAMASLRRTETGGFPIEKCYTLEQLSTLDTAALDALLLPVESLFSDHATVTPPPFYTRISRSGCVIYQKKIGTSFPLGTRVRLYDSERGGEFYALGEVGDYPDSAAPDGDSSAIKIIKLFSL